MQLLRRESHLSTYLEYGNEFLSQLLYGRNKLRRISILVIITVCLLAFSYPAFCQTIPSIKAKALDDSEVTLPKPSSQQVEVLIIGFSKKSGDTCQPWGKRISTELLLDPRVNYYQLPHLEGVPGFVKPMILRGMRKDQTPQQQAHMVPLYEKQEEWKKLVNFSAADDAYILLTDAEGHVVWQTHGPFSESAFTELKKAVSNLLQKNSN